MSQAEEIVRIAAKGDGVTASGRYAWGVARKEALLERERGGRWKSKP